MSFNQPDLPRGYLDSDCEILWAKIQLQNKNNSSTRESKLLDLVFTTNPTIVTHSVSVPGISDHDVIVTDFDVKNPIPK